MAGLRTLGIGLGLLHGLASLSQTVPGMGASLYYDAVPIETSLQSGVHVLHDPVRKLKVVDQKFANGTDPFRSYSGSWQPRVTLTQLRIDDYGQAGGPQQVSICVLRPDGEVLRCSNSIMSFAEGQTRFLQDNNLVAYQGATNVLIRSANTVGTMDTLAFFEVPLTAGEHAFSNSANGLVGALTVVDGDASIDLYWGLRRSHDFFSTRFGWTAGWPTATVSAYLNVPSSATFNQVNSQADPGTNKLRFGIGQQGSEPRPYVPLDIVAHEYAHIVLNWVGEDNLLFPYNEDDRAQKRALNESFSDMMAAAVEHEARQAFPELFPNSGKWNIGERTTSMLRSMSAPYVRRYQSQQWAEALAVSATNREAAAYAMAGVTNYWFHLLVEGGTAQVDGAAYTVEGVGMDDALAIAYRTFKHKFNGGLLGAPSFTDFAGKAVEAANELFPGGTATLQVQKALYAVNLLTTDPVPDQLCPGSATLVASTGSFGDGSGSANYQDGLDCNWLIQPYGAEQITVAFTSFNLASGDTVYLHGGTTAGAPLLARYHGTALPAPVVHTSGAVFVRFSTNASAVAQGWNLTYSTIGTTFCGTGNLLNTPSGTLSDGSGTGTYGPNTQCAWLISPPGATSVTLAFSSFATETNLDFVRVYSSLDTGQPPLLSHSGIAIPGPVTSNTGMLYIVFTSSPGIQLNGWEASWSSTGTGFCGGTATLTAATGTFTDGSGAADYYNNTDCAWLISPTGASAVQLNFSAFDVQSAVPTITDRLTIYDGADENASVIGVYHNSSPPGTIVSSGPELYLRFQTDNAVTADGWTATYTTLTGTTCSGTTVLTSPSGSFTDGSGASPYSDNALCNWLIQPPGAVSITLSFDAFSTQENADGVIVYDGPTTASPMLGIYTGTQPPPVLTSSGGSMLVRLVTDASIGNEGFAASYSANISEVGDLALVGYEYWYDDGVPVWIGIPPTYLYTLNADLPTDHLDQGLHTLHIRFKDSNGQWCSVLSRSFFKAQANGATPVTITGYEYWYDEGYTEKIDVGVGIAEQHTVDAVLDVTTLPYGLHMLHIRFQGTGGWSSVLSRSFFKAPGSDELAIEGYEYWYDGDYVDKVDVSLSPTAQFSLDEINDASALPNGLHVLNIRFRGAGGWSSVLSRNFFKAGNATSPDRLVDAYRYWFDSGEPILTLLSTPLSPYLLNTVFDASSLADGTHIFHIQFRDLSGLWCSVLSQPFEKVGAPNVLLPIKVILEGPFDPQSQLMVDQLRQLPDFPLTEPFSDLGFTHVGGGGGESIAPVVLQTVGGDAIVDWVLVEVRDKVNGALVVRTRSALLQRDGDVVDLDGINPLTLSLDEEEYHVAVRHRNHLGAMTAQPVAISLTTAPLDFSDPVMATYGMEARKNVSGTMVLWTGNVLPDDVLKYTGAANDRDPILLRIGGSVPTATMNGYFNEDVNLDGVVKYAGAANDRDPILVGIGGVVPTNTRSEQLP